LKKINELRIEKLSLGGAGLGFHDGKAIFVPGAVPGDVLAVELTHERSNHAFGRIINISTPSPDRIASPCPAFAAQPPCGGCDWLTLPYTKQVEYKSELLRELFSTFLEPDQILPFTPSPLSRHYRNKVFMPVGTDAKTGELICGIYSPWSHEIVPHPTCLNHPEIFDRLAQALVDIFRKSGVTAYNESTHHGILRHIGFRCNRDASEVLVILVTKSAKLPFSGLLVKQITALFPTITGIIQNINRQPGNVILGEETKLLWGSDHLADTLAGVSFQVNYRSFWQINTATMEQIITCIRKQVNPDATVLDAFCGIGAIGLSLSDTISRLILLEEQKEAILDARNNARLNNMDNVSFHTGLFADLLPQVLATHKPDTLILDPPRSGIDPASLQHIREAGIDRIIYLSCSPITLARDLKLLLVDGAYRCRSLQGFDMFPNTWHIESLAIMEKA